LDKIYQVFVSSTFADLEGERLQINDALAKAGYLVAGMELFPATDLQQLDFIKRIIDRSDYYVVVIAGRYGSIAEDGMSFTQHEYEYARSRGIPVLAFIHANPGSLSVARSDIDADLLKKLEAFRGALKTGRVVKFWNNVNELCTEIIVAVSQAINLTPGHGWVRGDQAVDPKVLQEMERLRIENYDLKKRMGDKDDLVFDEMIPGPDDLVDLTVSLHETTPLGDKKREESVAIQARYGDVFVGIHDNLLATPHEIRISQLIGSLYSDRFSKPFGTYTNFDIQLEQVESVRLVLEAQDLISVVSVGERHPVLAWEPTIKGKRYFLARRLKKIN